MGHQKKLLPHIEAERVEAVRDQPNEAQVFILATFASFQGGGQLNTKSFSNLQIISAKTLGKSRVKPQNHLTG